MLKLRGMYIVLNFGQLASKCRRDIIHWVPVGRGWIYEYDNQRILTRTASVNQAIYDQFGGSISGGQNNQKLIINTPDLHKL